MASKRNGHTAQKAETLQFWDDLYRKQDVDKEVTYHPEWIVQPDRVLLETIREHLPAVDRKNDDDEMGGLRILEIGCGTSTLSRDLYLHLQTTLLRGNKITVVATDASEICIRQQRRRRRDHRGLLHHVRGDDDKKDTIPDDSLDYRVWDVSRPPPVSFIDAFHVVLDKGCLDTFMFRSRTRGPQQPQQPGHLVSTVLGHVHQCLRENNGSNREEGHQSRYLVLTPRRKIKWIRDYPGFARVVRYDLHGTVSRGQLDGKDGDDNDVPTFLHVCTKDPSFDSGERGDIVSRTVVHPVDTDACPGCGQTFYDFRRGEALEGRGSVFWYRRWNGHCQHCNKKK